MGPKSENVGFSLVLPLLFEGSRRHEGAKESLQLSGLDRVGGSRGRVNPPRGTGSVHAVTQGRRILIKIAHILIKKVNILINKINILTKKVNIIIKSLTFMLPISIK